MKVIIVGVPTKMDALIEFDGCLSEFRKKGLNIRWCSPITREIETDHCRIRFVAKSGLPNAIRGLYADVSFGFSKDAQYYLNKSRKPTDYKGTFLDYIYEVEGIKTSTDEPESKKPHSIPDYVKELIEDAMKKRDRSVSLLFNPDGSMAVTCYPWPDEEENK